MVNFYWIAASPGALSSDFSNWSSDGSGGAPLTAWPGTSPDTADSFFFDGAATADCTWENSLASTMDDVASIEMETDELNLYTGTITLSIDLQLRGLKLNSEITDAGASKTITLTGTPLTSFNDTNSKKRYVLNGQKAKHGSSSTLTYKMSPGTTDVHLDNGPYNKLTIDTNPMTLAYNVPTATTHDNADDDTIHIKGAFNASSTGGFARDTAPDASADTAVKIKFDNTSFTYSNSTLDFVLATAHFRGIEVPVTGSQTYGTSSAGFTAKHYGVVIFASSNGDLCTIPNGVQLDCYSFEVKAGARIRVASADSNPATIKSQLQPIVKGVWSFQSLNSNVFVSPRNNPVTSVANGGTGLSSVESKALLMGNSATPMQPLTAISPGTDGYVLTMVSGTPAWAAASGGGGGAVDSVFGRTGTVVAAEGDYDLDELGDVDVTSAAETQILRHDGTSFVNEYNDIMFLRVKAREAINKGEAIYIFDAHNANVVGVKKAKADSSTTMPCIGVAYENLASGDEGLAVSFGKANGIAASGFTEGQTMYVSPTTAGALTNTKPTGNTELIQNVGILMKAHASNAVVKVTGIGRSNDVPNQFSVGGSITASSFIKSGGASTEFLKADGSVDTSTYSTATGVEDNADVTDAANVEAAGALMDYEVTNLPDVKAFNPADYATAAQGTLADSALQAAVTSIATTSPITGGTITSTGTIGISAATTSAAGSMSAGDKTKLDGIETGADKTFVSNTEQTNLTSGWYTVAYVEGRDSAGASNQRAFAQFLLRDRYSSRHQTISFNAAHHFGTDGSNNIQVLSNSSYASAEPVTGIRIKERSTYSGAALQIYIATSTSRVKLFAFMNEQVDGWVIPATPLADSDNTGHDAVLGYGSGESWTDFTVAKELDLADIEANAGGGMATTGGMFIEGDTEIEGTVRLTGTTSAVLVTDSNGDIGAATNLQDVTYLQSGGAQGDTFAPLTSAPSWAGVPPTTIQEAIDRIASFVAPQPGPQIP